MLSGLEYVSGTTVCFLLSFTDSPLVSRLSFSLVRALKGASLRGHFRTNKKPHKRVLLSTSALTADLVVFLRSLGYGGAPPHLSARATAPTNFPMLREGEGGGRVGGVREGGGHGVRDVRPAPLQPLTSATSMALLRIAIFKREPGPSSRRRRL